MGPLLALHTPIPTRIYFTAGSCWKLAFWINELRVGRKSSAFDNNQLLWMIRFYSNTDLHYHCAALHSRLLLIGSVIHVFESLLEFLSPKYAFSLCSQMQRRERQIHQIKWCYAGDQNPMILIPLNIEKTNHIEHVLVDLTDLLLLCCPTPCDPGFSWCYVWKGLIS